MTSWEHQPSILTSPSEVHRTLAFSQSHQVKSNSQDRTKQNFLNPLQKKKLSVTWQLQYQDIWVPFPAVSKYSFMGLGWDIYLHMPQYSKCKMEKTALCYTVFILFICTRVAFLTIARRMFCSIFPEFTCKRCRNFPNSPSYTSFNIWLNSNNRTRIQYTMTTTSSAQILIRWGNHLFIRKRQVL